MKYLRVLVLALVLLVSFSCTVKQDLTIKSGKDGEIFVDLELNPVFVRYINDLSETTGKSAKSGIFNTDEITRELKAYPSARPVSVVSPEPSKLILILKTENYTKLLPDKYVPFIRITDSDKVRKVTFHIGRDNYKALDEVFEISDNPILSGLAPQVDKPYTKEEYVDLLQYVFEDYLEKGESAQKILDKSYVQLNIKTSGKVLSSDKGTFKGNSLWIKLPLVDFLTLDKVVEFSFTYSI
ncbi:MAG: hypothetical protein IKX02_00415 [Spirochaetales bacterium]|nr:hypothetical protein [Spirochaetales bacterium]